MRSLRRRPPMTSSRKDLIGVSTFTPAARAKVLTEETEAVLALTDLVFENFRANPNELPAFPALAAQIFDLLERPQDEIDVNQVVQVLSREPATSALMLRVANSSRYGGARHINSVRDAVVRLGIKEVANLAVAAASKSLFDSEERTKHAQFEQFWSERWRHALTTAFSASWLAMESRTGHPQEAFVAGLLHDVGKSLALRVLGHLTVTGGWTRPIEPSELEFVLESTHIDIGSEAAVRWGLPAFVVDVCQEHHSDDASGLPAVVRLAADVYELKYNPLHRVSLADDIIAAALTLDINQRRFKDLAIQVTSFARNADEIAAGTTSRGRKAAR